MLQDKNIRANGGIHAAEWYGHKSVSALKKHRKKLHQSDTLMQPIKQTITQQT